MKITKKELSNIIKEELNKVNIRTEGAGVALPPGWTPLHKALSDASRELEQALSALDDPKFGAVPEDVSHDMQKIHQLVQLASKKLPMADRAIKKAVNQAIQQQAPSTDSLAPMPESRSRTKSGKSQRLVEGRRNGRGTHPAALKDWWHANEEN